MSNLAIFLPRALKIQELVAVCIIIFFGLGIMLYQGGEKIQRIVDEKSRVKDVPEATLVDLLFAIVLFVFKIHSKIPMSTTWAFIGILAGRELAITYLSNKNKIKYTYIIIAKDFGKVNIGLAVSLVIAFLIQYLK